LTALARANLRRLCFVAYQRRTGKIKGIIGRSAGFLENFSAIWRNPFIGVGIIEGKRGQIGGQDLWGLLEGAGERTGCASGWFFPDLHSGSKYYYI
jgi:hypothetical protein